MAASDSLATAGLKTQAHELIKQFIVYDAQSRMETIYTAPYKAADGAPCTRVDYTYRNATSTQVEKMRESNDVWSAAYDI